MYVNCLICIFKIILHFKETEVEIVKKAFCMLLIERKTLEISNQQTNMSRKPLALNQKIDNGMSAHIF